MPIVVRVGAARGVLDVYETAVTERNRVGDLALIGVGHVGTLCPAIAPGIRGAATFAVIFSERASVRAIGPEQNDAANQNGRAGGIRLVHPCPQ